MRAILMQLAHPAIAQGVAEHSNFQQDPIGRFVRTMSVVQDVLFGPPDVAIKAATRVYAKHARVEGVITDMHTPPPHAQARFPSPRGRMLG
ncbi:MAG: DUF2236 domain-containing protein [Anaerolineae bacterium]|nr:DUF2236 domain-containing protein [Anaerolineae bacterium]